MRYTHHQEKHEATITKLDQNTEPMTRPIKKGAGRRPAQEVQGLHPTAGEAPGNKSKAEQEVGVCVVVWFCSCCLMLLLLLGAALVFLELACGQLFF